MIQREVISLLLKGESQMSSLFDHPCIIQVRVPYSFGFMGGALDSDNAQFPLSFRQNPVAFKWFPTLEFDEFPPCSLCFSEFPSFP